MGSLRGSEVSQLCRARGAFVSASRLQGRWIHDDTNRLAGVAGTAGPYPAKNRTARRRAAPQRARAEQRLWSPPASGGRLSPGHRPCRARLDAADKRPTKSTTKILCAKRHDTRQRIGQRVSCKRVSCGGQTTAANPPAIRSVGMLRTALAHLGNHEVHILRFDGLVDRIDQIDRHRMRPRREPVDDQRFAAGVRQVAVVIFEVLATSATSTTITPADQPIPIQASGVNANSLPISAVLSRA